MIDLPQQLDATRYWQELYRQPLPYWQAALDQIMGEHGLERSPWTRAALGRNIVFVSPTAVIKLGPPMWAGEMAREAAALRSVTKQAEGWRITALIDWGDVKLGPRTHEFISPGVHMYQGDRAPLAAWYRGYGWGAHPDAARD